MGSHASAYEDARHVLLTYLAGLARTSRERHQEVWMRCLSAGRLAAASLHAERSLLL